jgi:single-strand DNA-binding protein
LLNRSILIGRLTRDPELRYTPSGVATAGFTLAVDRPFQTAGGEREADFIPVVTWRQLAETVANYVRKGSLVAVEGRIQTRNYESGDGSRKYVTEIIADNVRFLEPKRGEGSGGSNTAGSGSGASGGHSGASRDPFVDDGRPLDISDDELPF